MTAEKVFEISGEPAPKEWESIPGIKEARPIHNKRDREGFESSLQRFVGTNLCCWFVRRSVYWNPVGDIFKVTE